MRLCAVAYGTLHHPMNSHEEIDSEVKEERHQHEFSSQEKLYYNRAIGYYIKGKEVLRRASTDRSIWYNLECDLASVYYTMGQQLQERPPLSTLTVSEVCLFDCPSTFLLNYIYNPPFRLKKKSSLIS